MGPASVDIANGDLAAPNVLLHGDKVAALVDFQPPKSRYVSWEIARIGCDPRTVILSEGWVAGLADLLISYHAENPALPVQELTSTIAVGCAYTISSTYPLAEPVEKPGAAVEQTLRTYAYARHDAALRMLHELDRDPQVLRDLLGTR